MTMPTRRELLQRILDGHLAVAQAIRPQILVVTDQPRSIVRQDHAEPESADELGVGEMRHHVANRPLARRFRPRHDLRRHRLDNSLNRRGRFPQHGDRIPVAKQA
jgi:hypothetical protein